MNNISDIFKDSTMLELQSPFQKYTTIDSREWNWSTYISSMPIEAISEVYTDELKEDFKSIKSIRCTSMDKYSNNDLHNYYFYLVPNDNISGTLKPIRLLSSEYNGENVTFASDSLTLAHDYSIWINGEGLHWGTNTTYVTFPSKTGYLVTNNEIKNKISSQGIKSSVCKIYDSGLYVCDWQNTQVYPNYWFLTTDVQTIEFNITQTRIPDIIIPTVVLALENSNLHSSYNEYYYAYSNTYEPMSLSIINSSYDSGKLTVQYTLPPMVYIENTTTNRTEDGFYIRFLCIWLN